MGNICHTLTNRRYGEKHIAYAESHDQVKPDLYVQSKKFGRLSSLDGERMAIFMHKTRPDATS